MATGKIARLPRAIREELNERLVGGAPGGRLAAWLNGLPAVQRVLAEDFGGSAINEQNLSNWRRGGHRDWRAEREARAFSQSLAGEAVPVVTAEQMASSLTVRYLMVIREWQREKMPVERRWRQLRVMCGDILKLRRCEYQAERLELEGERLEFAMERFAEEQQTDERRAMVGFLGAARQWPEVQEALTAAFRLFRERKEAETEGKEAELEPIKVNQGGKNKKEEAQDEFGGLRQPPPDVGWLDIHGMLAEQCSALRSKPAFDSGSESTALNPRRSAETPLRVNLPGSEPDRQVLAFRTGVNKAKLNQIKVDQGGKIKKVEGRDETEGFLDDCGDGPSPPRGRQDELVGYQPLWTGSWSHHGLQCDSVQLEGGRGLWELMGLNRSEIFYLGWEKPGAKNEDE